jgi:hypothetical protein
LSPPSRKDGRPGRSPKPLQNKGGRPRGPASKGGGAFYISPSMLTTAVTAAWIKSGKDLDAIEGFLAVPALQLDGPAFPVHCRLRGLLESARDTEHRLQGNSVTFYYDPAKPPRHYKGDYGSDWGETSGPAVYARCDHVDESGKRCLRPIAVDYSAGASGLVNVFKHLRGHQGKGRGKGFILCQDSTKCMPPGELPASHQSVNAPGVSYGPLCFRWGLTLARPPLVCAGRVLGCAGEI